VFGGGALQVVVAVDGLTGDVAFMVEGSLSTRLFIMSATYTLPAASTATPVGAERLTKGSN
jgi:hypothetical protein